MRKTLLFLFSHRTLALLRWDFYFITLRIKNFFLLKKRELNAILEAKDNELLYLNLGSGPRGLKSKNWLNIDGFLDENVEYVCDFNRKLPFKNATFNGIFCEHVLEHFDYHHGKELLEECYRILKPNGVIRIIVPDGEKILKSYFENPKKIIQYKECETGFAMEAVNRWFYQRYEHQQIYDFYYLKNLLLECNFSKVERGEFNKPTLSKKTLIIDDKKYAWESLYIEALK